MRLLNECRAAAEHKNPMHRSPHLYPVVTIALHTGMRLREITRMEWDRVDLTRGVFRLEAEHTKTRKGRDVPMTTDVYTVVSKLPRRGPRLFSPSIKSAFLGALKRAGIENFRFHDLRHTCASWMVMRGRSLKEVAELLGHTSVAMTQKYAHLSPEHLRQAVSVLDGFGFSTTSAQSQNPPAETEVTTRQS